MKHYTSIEQSKKLAEILPIESADMFYGYGMDIHTKKWDYDIVPTIIDASNQIDIGDIPCWSLAALINIINTNYYTALYHDGIAWNIDIIHHDNVKDKHSACANTPIDALYEIIIKLHEENLL